MGNVSRHPGAEMKSRACCLAAATYGCPKSTMKTTHGPSSTKSSWTAVCRKSHQRGGSILPPSTGACFPPPAYSHLGVFRPKWASGTDGGASLVFCYHCLRAMFISSLLYNPGCWDYLSILVIVEILLFCQIWKFLIYNFCWYCCSDFYFSIFYIFLYFYSNF